MVLTRLIWAAFISVSALACAAQGARVRGETFSTVARAFSTSAGAQKPAQPDPTERQNEKENAKGSKGDITGKQRRGGRGREGSGQPSRPRQYHVTFKTDPPRVSINQMLSQSALKYRGMTDSSGELTVELPAGHYVFIASLDGFQPERLELEVGSHSTNALSFTLKPVEEDKSEAKVKEPAPEPTPAATPTPPPPPSVEEIINRFLDPEQTQGLTVDDWQSALEQAKAAQAKQPDNTLYEAQKLLAQGQIAYMRGEFADAVVILNRAVLAQPRPALAAIPYALANAYLATESEPKQALKFYQQASKISPNLSLPYKGCGDALAKLNKKKDAQRCYDTAKRLSASAAAQPTPTPAPTPMPATAKESNDELAAARSLIARKRLTEALNNLQQLARTTPTADVYILIGECYEGLKQPRKALEAYAQAKTQDPKSAIAFYRHGLLSFNINEYAEAIDSLEHALALDKTGVNIDRKRAREISDKAKQKLSKMK